MRTRSGRDQDLDASESESKGSVKLASDASSRKLTPALEDEETIEVASIASLPAELLCQVFEYFQYRYLHRYVEDRASVGTLCRFALVCRAWRWPAQRALHAVPLLRVGKVAAWLQSAARPLHRVERLAVDTDMTLDIARRLKIWNECPDLTALCVMGPLGYFWCLDDRAKGIKDLRVLQLAEFPRLEKPLDLRLDRFDLFVSPFTTIHPHHLITFLSSSRETLRLLELTHLGDETTSANLIEFFTTEEFDNVRCLIFRNSKGTVKLHWPKFLRCFPFLRRLDIYGFDPASIYAVSHGATTALEVLTLGSERDGLGYPLDQSILGRLGELVAEPNLAGLRRLNVPAAAASSFDNPSGLAFLEECEERGIAVRCRYGYVTKQEIVKRTAF